MICTDICESLYRQILEQNFKAVIHSVFSSSLNILDKDQNFITFLNSQKAMGPNSIRINENISFIDLGFKPGFQINFLNKYAEIENLNIKIHYSKSKHWNKEPSLDFERDLDENIYLKLEKMGKFLLDNGNKAGIYPLLTNISHKIEGLDLIMGEHINPRDEEDFIKYRFLHFIENYMEENMTEISSSVKNIIGYGIGLTPSMDDFISGIMVSKIYISYYREKNLEDAYEFNSAMIKEIKNKTTIISEEMLKYSSLAQTNEYIKQLMISFLGKFPIEEFERNLASSINIGATSGTDMLLGIYTVSCILLYEL